MEWLNPSENLSIQHALNVGKHRGPNTHYNLDGYDPTTHTGYEFQGCLHHRCQVCYPDTKHPLTKQSSKELYTLTKKKETLLIWECQFRKLIQTNRELAQFFEWLRHSAQNSTQSPFLVVQQLQQNYHCVTGDEKIKYMDFTSLYPYVDEYIENPIGDP